MLSPLKDYAGPWERARANLTSDIEHITAAINSRWAATFGNLNFLGVLSGGTGVNKLAKHGVVVGQDQNPVTVATGTGVLHMSTTADPVASPVVEGDVTMTDITTNNVSSTKHGFAPKSPADATKFLNGAATPAYAQVKDSDLALTDITTNNASATAHGFLPKLPNDGSKFLDGTGGFSTAGGMPVVGATPATGKRIIWFQKADNNNTSNMATTGISNATNFPTISGGSGVFDAAGYWSRPTGSSGGVAQWHMATGFCRIEQLPKFVARVRTPASLATIRLCVSLNEYLNSVNSDSPSITTQRGLYVRYSTAVPDGGWVVQSVNSAGRTVSGTILAIAASTIYIITITVISSASIKVDINGTSVLVSANIPTGVDLGIEVTAGALAAVTPSIDIESLYLES